MIEKLFWLSFFTLWWLLLLEVVEVTFLPVSSLLLFGVLGALLTADRHVQEGRKKK